MKCTCGHDVYHHALALGVPAGCNICGCNKFQGNITATEVEKRERDLFRRHDDPDYSDIVQQPQLPFEAPQSDSAPADTITPAGGDSGGGGATGEF